MGVKKLQWREIAEVERREGISVSWSFRVIC